MAAHGDIIHVNIKGDIYIYMYMRYHGHVMAMNNAEYHGNSMDNSCIYGLIIPKNPPYSKYIIAKTWEYYELFGWFISRKKHNKFKKKHISQFWEINQRNW